MTSPISTNSVNFPALETDITPSAINNGEQFLLAASADKIQGGSMNILNRFGALLQNAFAGKGAKSTGGMSEAQKADFVKLAVLYLRNGGNSAFLKQKISQHVKIVQESQRADSSTDNASELRHLIDDIANFMQTYSGTEAGRISGWVGDIGGSAIGPIMLLRAGKFDQALLIRLDGYNNAYEVPINNTHQINVNKNSATFNINLDGFIIYDNDSVGELPRTKQFEQSYSNPVVNMQKHFGHNVYLPK